NVCLLTGSGVVAGRALGARASALVMFAPIAIVDGTVNPHNDAFLALATAAFGLALARRREAAGVVALAAALLIKLSAALLLWFDLLQLALRSVAARLRPSTVIAAGIAVAVVGVVLLVAAPHLWPALGAFTALVGDPAETNPHF